MNIVVCDNGVGFNTKEIKQGSFGLIGLQERIELIKGSMEVQSVIGQGTLVMFQIPYPVEK